MKTYEGMFLVDSAAAKDAENWNNVTSHVSDILTKNGAEIIKAEKWSERKLAYEIRGCKRGAYLLVHFNAPGSAIAPLKRDCQLSETILRTLIVIDEDGDVTANSEKETEAKESPVESEVVSEEKGEQDEGEGKDELTQEALEHQPAETEVEDVNEGDEPDTEQL